MACEIRASMNFSTNAMTDISEMLYDFILLDVDVSGITWHLFDSTKKLVPIAEIFKLKFKHEILLVQITIFDYFSGECNMRGCFQNLIMKAYIHKYLIGRVAWSGVSPDGSGTGWPLKPK